MLELQNISYLVDDDNKEILRDINLAFDEKFVAITGPNGSGKSTLGRTLVKIYPATGGKVLYKGRDIARLGKEEEKHFLKEVQMIFQDHYASLNPIMTVG